MIPKLNKIEWHDNDWELSPHHEVSYNHYYLVKRIDVDKDNRCTTPASRHITQSSFVMESDAKRVIKLWNATRHLSDKDLNALCHALLEQRDEFLRKNDG